MNGEEKRKTFNINLNKNTDLPGTKQLVCFVIKKGGGALIRTCFFMFAHVALLVYPKHWTVRANVFISSFPSITLSDFKLKENGEYKN